MPVRNVWIIFSFQCCGSQSIPSSVKRRSCSSVCASLLCRKWSCIYSQGDWQQMSQNYPYFSIIYFLGVCCVIQSWSYSYFKRVLEGTHLWQSLLRINNNRIVAIACSCYICETAGPSDSHFLDRQTGYWKARGTFRCGEARLNSSN